MKKGEHEIDWLKRALKSVCNNINLKEIFKHKSDNIVNEIIKITYRNTRIALFHSKSNKSKLSQYKLKHREIVSDALSKLTQTYLLLVRKWLGLRKMGGYMTPSAFQIQLRKALSDPKIILFENRFNKKKSLKYAELPLEKTILLDAKYSETLSENGKYSILASTSSQELKPFKKIYGFIVANGDTLFMNQTLESRLTIDSIDKLEIQAGFQLVNVRDHKKIFDT